MGLPASSADKIQAIENARNEKIFENSEYVTTNGAAKYLSKLLGKEITANAIRLRVHRGHLKPEKPFGSHGESVFRVSELRLRFTRSHQKGR